MADYTSDEDEAEYTPGPEKKAARSAPGKRLFTETSRHANGGPPPGMDPGKRNLDKGQRDTQSDEVAEEGNERQGGSPSNSKKQKHDNGYDLDDSSGHGIGTPPLTSSNNNNYMFFFCLGGGGGTPKTLFTHGLSTDESTLGPESSLSRRQSSTSDLSGTSGRSRNADDSRSGSLRGSDGLAPSMEWTQEGT